MALFFHIAIAIINLAYAGYLYTSPTKLNFYFTYFLTAVSFSSGFYLVWNKPSHLIEACIMGILYFGLITFSVISAKRKLKRIEVVEKNPDL